MKVYTKTQPPKQNAITDGKSSKKILLTEQLKKIWTQKTNTK